jgi:putative ABC transport system permease protein
MKNFIAGISNGLAEVWAHKLRSLLTITCVFLGVASLTAVMGLLEGLATSWSTWFAEFGGLEKVSAVAEDSVDDQRQIVFSTLTLRDAAAVRKLCKDAAYISPEIFTEALTLHRGRMLKVPVQGVERDALVVNRYELKAGRFITDADNLGYENVAVLGSAPVETLFEPGETVLGSTIYIKGLPFRVVGELRHYTLMQEGENVLRQKNEVVFIPLTAMQKKILGKPELSSLSVQVRDVSALREIGIRKALGAWGWDIFVQFIAEAITLSLIGGVAGAAFGVGLIRYLQVAMADSSPPVLSSNAVLVGFSISVAIGVLSGLYPALKASKLDPIEALRYE